MLIQRLFFKAAQADLQIQYTTVGIHKDDLLFSFRPSRGKEIQ
jgi:recombinational DNA repair ATPase RecF